MIANGQDPTNVESNSGRQETRRLLTTLWTAFFASPNAICPQVRLAYCFAGLCRISLFRNG